MSPTQPVRIRTFHSYNRHSFKRRGGVVGSLLVCLGLVGVVAWIGYAFVTNDDSKVDQGDLIVEKVVRGPFDHIVLEQGELESSSNTEVVCEVKSRGTSGTPILWVIDEGTKVEEGDKLVELDSSQLEVELKDDRIKVTMATANVTTAVAAVEQSKIARQEYLEGVFKTEERAINSEMAVAQQDLRKAQLALESSQRLVAKGLVKSLQLEADKFAVANAQNQLEAAEGRLKVLQNLTRKKMLVQFDSEIEANEAKLAHYKGELAEEEMDLADTKAQIENCVLTAPASGVVVHANRYSSRGGSAEFVVEAGSNVRERQAIIRLPDPSLMQVNCKVNETRVTLIAEGMPVRIRVDAIPGLKLLGRVKKVNRYAEPGSYFSSSIKEYATTVEIIDPPEVIRTGMTAEVQIFVQQLEDALQIPIQGLYQHGEEMFSLVQTGPETFETRKLEIGATNDTMASIKSGLSEDETVVLNLRQHLNLMDLPELKRQDNSGMKDVAGEIKAPVKPIKGEGKKGGKDGRKRGGGGPSGGGPGGGGQGGGMPDTSTIVQRIFERLDTDGDGELSSAEIKAISDSERRSGTLAADSNGDGKVTRGEMTASIKKRMGN